MLKNPYTRFKLCVGGSGDAGFSSGSSEADSSYDSGAGSVSSNPGVSTSLESQAQAQAAANQAAGYGDYWSNPANTEAGRELAAQGNTISNPASNSDGETNPYNPLTNPGRYANYQALHPTAITMTEREALLQVEPNRAGYTPTLDIGDTKTRQLMQQGLTQMQALNQQLRDVSDPRSPLYTPSTTDDRFYANELDKANANLIELSAAKHAWGNQVGLPTGPNEFEYVGDLALALQKGTNGKSSARGVSPTDLSVLQLPSGRGLQDVAWDNAMDNYRTGGKNQQQPDWSYQIDVIERAKSSGAMGPYGDLKSTSSVLGILDLPTQQMIGFQAAKSAGWDVDLDALYNKDPGVGYNALGFGVPFNPMSGKGEVKQIPMQNGNDMILPAPFITRNAPSETMGDGKLFGLPVPGLAFFQGGEKRQATVNADKTTTFAVTPIASPFDVWQGGISEKVYGGLGGVFSIGRSPVTGEKAKSTHDAVTRMFGAWTNKNPMFAPLAATASVGREAMDKPVEAGIFVAEGIAFGGLMRGAGAVYGGLARVPMAEAAISQGGKWRTALQASDFLTSKAVPGALAGMYGIDVTARSTNMFSDFKMGNVTLRASPILALETVPMTAGMGIGYNAPEIASFAYRSAVKTPGKVSEAIFTARQRAAGFERIPKGSDFAGDINTNAPQGKGGIFNNPAQKATPAREPYAEGDWNWGKKRLGGGGFVDTKPTEATAPFMGQATKPVSGPTRPTFVGSFSFESASPKAPIPYDIFGEMGGPQLQMQREPVAEPSRKLGYKPASTFDFQKYMRKDGVNVDLYRQSMGVTTSHDTPFEREMMVGNSPASNRQRASSPFTVGQPIGRSGSFWEQRTRRNTMPMDLTPYAPGVPSSKRTPSVSPMGILSPFASQATRPRDDTAPIPFIRPATRPQTRTTTDPFQTPQPRITTQPKPTIIPLGGFPLLGGGGGTSGPAFGMGLDRWANVNPTATIGYLSKGMGDPFSPKKGRRKKKFHF